MENARRLLPLIAATIGFVGASGALYIADRPIDRAALARLSQIAQGGQLSGCSVRADRFDREDPPPFFTAVPACR